MDYEECFEYKLDEYKEHLVNKNKISRFQSRFKVYIKNNIRVIGSFTFYHWRIIELLEEGKVDMVSLNTNILQELLNVILPNGDSMLHRLIQKNIVQFEKLMTIIQTERRDHKANFKLNFLPNMKGLTPLHLCIKNAYSKPAESILIEIGNYPMDDHIRFIKDTFSSLLNICPVALGDYLDMRIIKPKWSINQTLGILKKPDPKCNFSVVPL